MMNNAMCEVFRPAYKKEMVSIKCKISQLYIVTHPCVQAIRAVYKGYKHIFSG